MLLGNFIVKFNGFWVKHKLLFFVCLAAFFAVLGIGISRLQISESIFSSLPKAKSFEQFNKLIENKNIINQVVFSINVPDNADADELQQTISDFADSLTDVSNNLLKEIKATRPDAEQQVYNYYYQNFPFLIDSGYYSEIDKKIIPDSIRNSVNASFRQLTSPGSAFLKNFILNDPLFISGNYFKELGEINNSQDLTIEDGIVYTKDKKKILVTAKTNFESGNSENNVLLNNKLNVFKEQWSKQHPSYSMDFFGTFQIAAENAVRVKKDTQFTLVATLVIILLILFVYYRKLLIPVYFLLPGFSGAVFALGVIGFIHPQISAISLATSAVILGIILDYSFHFFTHVRHTGSIDIALKEMSAPLLTGSFTTITAFSALLFTNSEVLQNFGMFAALALAAAGIFTLTGLPIILKITGFNYKGMPPEFLFFKFPKLSTKFRVVALAVIGVLTVFFYYQSKNIKFDSDLENLSYHTSDLKNKEQELTGINPEFEKKIYLFADDKDYNKAANANFNAFEKLVSLKKSGEIKSFLSTSPFFIPDNIKQEKEILWKNYWSTHKQNVFAVADKTADSLGFNVSAFSNFKTWINNETRSEENTDSLSKLLGLDNLIEVGNNKTQFISTLVVKNENLESVKAQLRAVDGIELFDRSETATAMLTLVKDDFNFLLITSSLIVFFTLLLIYGRIELTLLTFLPMLISWIWILGIAAMLNIQFNFVNVVIATFIFGLGDDYCIFVTDGLLQKYKYGKDNLRSFKSAIVLSALATITGTGVLFFAEHPAIHSVAAISVLGITIILFLSLMFQATLFDFFVQNRIEKRKTPVSLFTFIFSVLCFSYFTVICLSSYIVGLLIAILPVSKKNKTIFINRFISFCGWSVMYLGIQVKKQIFNKENLDFKKPSIIIANHTSFLDILLMLMLHHKIILMVKSWVYHSPLMGVFIRRAGYIYTEKGTEENLELIKQRIADGYSVMIFPEGSRSTDAEIKRFHKGAFALAQELKLDITPVLLHGVNYVLPKDEYLVRRGETNVKILPRIKYDDASYGTTYQQRTKSISKYFKAEHKKFTLERESAKYMWNRVYQNYIFKGPVLEWYIRIKWKLEKKNFEHYNELIGDRKNITDFGCGYGYLSYYLHYKNVERKILGVDYDQEKVEIAQHGFDKTTNLQFQSADITTFYFTEKQDVIFLNDVLHYLTEENQNKVLQNCADNLNIHGLLIIRDGITDLSHRHKNTKLTELLSTKIIGFNKNKNELHFFNSAFIKSFAQQNNMLYEMMEQSKKTSNVLFVLKK